MKLLIYEIVYGSEWPGGEAADVDQALGGRCGGNEEWGMKAASGVAVCSAGPVRASRIRGITAVQVPQLCSSLSFAS